MVGSFKDRAKDKDRRLGSLEHFLVLFDRSRVDFDATSIASFHATSGGLAYIPSTFFSDSLLFLIDSICDFPRREETEYFP